ncbi:MAG: hypothetical protein WBB97_03980, partial [Dehalococcoidales bacterium]
FKRALIYTLIAIMLSLLFYFLAGNIIKISSNNFVAIMSSTSAASGALLAVSIAFYTFLGRYMADWRDRLYERFIKERDELKSQIQISAKHHPEISRRLVDLYLFSAQYILGQKIKKDEVYEAANMFHPWAKEKSETGNFKFDFGDLSTYDSFAKHLFDAHFYSTAVRNSLIDLSVAEISGRPLLTFPSLITTWAGVLIFSLVSAIIGGTGIICENCYISMLIIPAFLLPFATITLILDFRNLMHTMRIYEIGHEKALEELVKKS